MTGPGTIHEKIIIFIHNDQNKIDPRNEQHWNSDQAVLYGFIGSKCPRFVDFLFVEVLFSDVIKQPIFGCLPIYGVF